MSKRTGALKHIHKYFQRYDGLWACNGYGGCSHFMPKNMAPLPVGQLSICWKCDKSFLMVQYHMEDTHPKCDNCMEADSMIGEIIPPQPVIRTSIVQSMPPRASQTHVQRTMEDDGHSVECDVYIGGICTCYLSKE